MFDQGTINALNDRYCKEQAESELARKLHALEVDYYLRQREIEEEKKNGRS